MIKSISEIAMYVALIVLLSFAVIGAAVSYQSIRVETITGSRYIGFLGQDRYLVEENNGDLTAVTCDAIITNCW